jgi:hypothetical protein
MKPTKCWPFVSGEILSESECDELIELAEQHGIEPPQASTGTLRTAKRTAQYRNRELSERVFSRLEEILQ